LGDRFTLHIVGIEESKSLLLNNPMEAPFILRKVICSGIRPVEFEIDKVYRFIGWRGRDVCLVFTDYAHVIDSLKRGVRYLKSTRSVGFIIATNFYELNAPISNFMLVADVERSNTLVEGVVKDEVNLHILRYRNILEVLNVPYLTLYDLDDVKNNTLKVAKIYIMLRESAY